MRAILRYTSTSSEMGHNTAHQRPDTTRHDTTPTTRNNNTTRKGHSKQQHTPATRHTDTQASQPCKPTQTSQDTHDVLHGRRLHAVGHQPSRRRVGFQRRRRGRPHPAGHVPPQPSRRVNGVTVRPRRPDDGRRQRGGCCHVDNLVNHHQAQDRLLQVLAHGGHARTGVGQCGPAPSDQRRELVGHVAGDVGANTRRHLRC